MLRNYINRKTKGYLKRNTWIAKCLKTNDRGERTLIEQRDSSLPDLSKMASNAVFMMPLAILVKKCRHRKEVKKNHSWSISAYFRYLKSQKYTLLYQNNIKWLHTAAMVSIEKDIADCFEIDTNLGLEMVLVKFGLTAIAFLCKEYKPLPEELTCHLHLVLQNKRKMPLHWWWEVSVFL